MRRHALVLTFALGSLAVPALSRTPVRADDPAPEAKTDAKAAEDYKALQDWLAGETPKTQKEKDALRVELTKRCRTFLKDHPDSGTATFSIRDTLAELLYSGKKPTEALPLWEALVKSTDPIFAAKGRIGVVKCLITTDRKSARTRLDAFLKDHPDDEGLVAEDKYLKDNPAVAAKEPKVGEAPPALASKSLAGDEVSLDKLKGSVVLVDFWATWCPPCKKELPNLKKLYSELHSKGFEILGVDFAEKDPSILAEYIKKEQIGWPQIVADAKPISRAYNVQVLPRTILLDKEGKIAALDLRGDDLTRAIRALVDGKPIPEKKAAPAEGQDEGGSKGGMDEGEK